MSIILNILFVFVFGFLGLAFYILQCGSSNHPIYNDVDPKYEKAMNALKKNEEIMQNVVTIIIYLFCIVMILCLAVSYGTNLLQDKTEPIPEHIYKVELKSGKIVEATECKIKEDRSICIIEGTRYVVTSFEEITK